jgi:hypothetical protein
LIAQYNGVSPAAEGDRRAEAMQAVLTKNLTLRGFFNYEFAEKHYPRSFCASCPTASRTGG